MPLRRREDDETKTDHADDERPYHMRAAGQLLEAWSIAELAELVQCAYDARDDVELLRVRQGGRLRLLSRHEFAQLLVCLSPPAGS